jgi:hypothetical protein
MLSYPGGRIVKTKSANRVVVLAALLLVPMISFAETTLALTRDQVRAELRQLEQAGYEPAASHDARYPADLQVAEAAVGRGDRSVQIPAADRAMALRRAILRKQAPRRSRCQFQSSSLLTIALAGYETVMPLSARKIDPVVTRASSEERNRGLRRYR